MHQTTSEYPQASSRPLSGSRRFGRSVADESRQAGRPH